MFVLSSHLVLHCTLNHLFMFFLGSFLATYLFTSSLLSGPMGKRDNICTVFALKDFLFDNYTNAYYYSYQYDYIKKCVICIVFDTISIVV